MDLKKYGISIFYFVLGVILAAAGLFGSLIQTGDTLFLVSAATGLMIILYADLRIRIEGGYK